MDLTDRELAFLGRHGFSATDVFDARGMPARQWKAEAKSANKGIVLGSPCQAARHRLRTRAGHCAQCDPSKIAYQRRYNSPGYVYVAESSSYRVSKIGTAIDIEQRERNLRGQKYGGISDWRIVFSIEVSEGGHVERAALALLEGHRTTYTFEKDYKDVDASEILSCSSAKAIEAVKVSVNKFASTIEKSRIE